MEELDRGTPDYNRLTYIDINRKARLYNNRKGTTPVYPTMVGYGLSTISSWDQGAISPVTHH